MEDTTTKSVVNLNDAAEQNLLTGVLLLCKEALVTAIQDHRLNRGHLRVLAAVASFINAASAKAWPSRTRVASVLGMSVANVSNILSELKGFGYLIADREPVREANNRRLTVYTFGNIDHETIRREIEAFVRKVRDQRRSEEFTPQGEVHPIGGSSNRVITSQGEDRPHSSPPRGNQTSPPRVTRNSYKELNNKKAAGAEYWHKQLNPGSPDYSVAENGVVLLSGGARVSWLEKFGDEETLTLALAQISQYVQPNSGRPLSIQVEAQLARVVLDRLDKDRRYKKRAAEGQPTGGDNKSRRERMRQFMEEEAAKLQAGRRK